MLELAGLGAAVSNATPACLRAADKVIPSNDEGGVRELIKFLL
jgi:hydroxymethylpyrimidine pyrophosphatase-like HAD family hydrolase